MPLRLGITMDTPGVHDVFADTTTPASLAALRLLGSPSATTSGTSNTTLRRTRQRKPKPLPEPVLVKVHVSLKTASYTAGGQDWQMLFRQLDADGSGTLELEELRSAVRRTLRISPMDIDDDTIVSLFGMLDEDGGGELGMEELIAFLEQGPKWLLGPREKPAVAGSAPGSPGGGSVSPTGRRTVKANPSSGFIRRRELQAPWVAPHQRRIKIENMKAEAAMQEKRVVHLARQTERGLANMGVRYELTTIANVLRLAFKFRGASGEELDLLPNGKEVEHALIVLDAAQRFDLKRVFRLLSGHPVKEPATFGYKASIGRTVELSAFERSHGHRQAATKKSVAW